MKTIDSHEAIDAARFVDHQGWTLFVASLVIVLLSLTLSVNARDVQAAAQAAVGFGTRDAAPSTSDDPA